MRNHPASPPFRPTPPPARVLPGQPIPPFALSTADDRVIHTDQIRGRRVILAFAGGFEDPIGQKLLRRLDAARPLLRTWGAMVLAIALWEVDLNRFAAPARPLSFPVLRDPNGVVHREFGAVNWGGIAAPALFLIDRNGYVIDRALAGLGEALPSTADLITLLQLDQIAPTGLFTPNPGFGGGRTHPVPEPVHRHSVIRRPAGNPRR